MIGRFIKTGKRQQPELLPVKSTVKKYKVFPGRQPGAAGRLFAPPRFPISINSAR